MADCPEIMPFFVLDIIVVGELHRMRVDEGLPVFEHHGEAGQVVGDGRVARVALGEVGTVFQSSVL